jgi:glycine/D-amino acid oxidase-like deaminating enzyme/nitrite reductase/ring-hydroxylating ferredoxin subunit
MTNATKSLWHATHQVQHFAPLNHDLAVDVAIVGGGVSGVTAALLLARAGKRVALIERDRVGSGETGYTTSHLTEAVDGRYQDIVNRFGEPNARLVAQASREAIDIIERFTTELSLDCGFERLTGYLYTERESDLDWLARELDAARQAGCDVQWTDSVPLPFATRGGIAWPRQARVHPLAYLNGIARAAAAHGAFVFEGTRITEVEEGDRCVLRAGPSASAGRGTFQINARDVFIAANVPVSNRFAIHTKIAAYRSYAVAMETDALDLPGMFWDTDDPYHYTRTQHFAGRTYLIVGGEDHRTGEQTETDEAYERLIAYAHARFGHTPVRYRWSGQIIEPVDGLPYIGRNTGSTHVYVATGFSGNGITFGTMAASMVTAQIGGATTAYDTLFDATRVTPVASAVDYVTENVAYPIHLLKDRLTRLNTEDRAPDELAPEEGGVFASSEGKIAVCRDRTGKFHVVSAVCTHLACDVAWNKGEQTWDCPCHGSRFSPDGKVINGPAVTDLRPVPAYAIQTTRR